jgi:hypothetical protein
MDAHQIRIEDTTPDFLLSRANDQLLIPLFHEKGIRDDHLHRLNLCRLFLQVLTISYQTGCGTKITKAAWKGGRDTTRTSSYQWPHRTTQCQDWILWRKSPDSGLWLIDSFARALASTEARCRWFLMPQLSDCTKVGIDTTYYPIAPGRPSRNAMRRTVSRYADSGILLPPKGLRSKVRTTSCGLGHSQVAHQRSGKRTADFQAWLQPYQLGVTRPYHG